MIIYYIKILNIFFNCVGERNGDFVFVVLVLFSVPRPAVILTVTQSLKGRWKAGIMTGVGIATGDLIHTIASVLGLSAILITSEFAFEIVKYLGAAYLFVLNIRALMTKSTKDEKLDVKKDHSILSFRQAVLIELLNPKTALFFLAFLPQFVQNDSYPVVVQLLILGLTFVLMSIMYTTLLAACVSLIGDKLFQKKGFMSRWQDKIVGFIYIGLGLKLVFETQK